MSEELDRAVRLFVYERFLEAGAPPSLQDVAAALDLSAGDAEGSFRRLEASRVLVFAPGTLNI